MNDKGGFTLIECMVYIVVLSIIVLLFFSGTLHLYRVIRISARSNSCMLSLYSAGDTFARDIRLRPPFKNHIEYSANGIIWYYQDSRAIGWFLKDEALVRVEGIYTLGTGTWSDHTKSIICKPITTVRFLPYGPKGQELCITLSHNESTMELILWLP